MKKLLLMVMVTFALTVNCFADQIDLSTWSYANYDMGGGQSAGNWVLSADKKTVTQIVNADPSMYLNNLNQTAYRMEGTWQVKETGGDDDFMGFVFGYKDNSHFYLMDWKQGQQDYVGKTAFEGFSVKKISAPNKSDLDLVDFWSSTNTTYTTILSTNYGNDKGWADNTIYKFILDFTNIGFNIKVQNAGGTTTLWEVNINDTSYTSGQFGFYNFSQQDVEYSGFIQTGGVIVDPVPEPATMFLFGLGLLGVAGVSRKKN